jgi:hypothetical protein
VIASSGTVARQPQGALAGLVGEDGGEVPGTVAGPVFGDRLYLVVGGVWVGGADYFGRASRARTIVFWLVFWIGVALCD